MAQKLSEEDFDRDLSYEPKARFRASSLQKERAYINLKREEAKRKEQNAKQQQRQQENRVVFKIMKELKKRGYKPIKNHGSPNAQRGRPDIEVLITFPLLPLAVFFAIEVKRNVWAKPSTQQRARLEDIREQGGVAIVARDWSAVEAAIERTRRYIIDWFKGVVDEDEC